jgi:hypothetical protein
MDSSSNVKPPNEVPYSHPEGFGATSAAPQAPAAPPATPPPIQPQSYQYVPMPSFPMFPANVPAQSIPGLHPAPVPGVQMFPPSPAPEPGQVLLGYEMIEPKAGCCQCAGLSFVGWMSVLLLVIFFWPLAWVPCVMQSCFEPCQRPVFGWPQQQQQGFPGPAGIATPYEAPFPPAQYTQTTSEPPMATEPPAQVTAQKL